jgi:hypothetical protein
MMGVRYSLASAAFHPQLVEKLVIINDDAETLLLKKTINTLAKK